MNDEYYSSKDTATEVAVLDKSKVPDLLRGDFDYELEIRKFCVINAGTLVINTAGSSKNVSPAATIDIARDLYLFLICEDPVVDGDGDDGFDKEYADNVVPFKKPLIN